MCAPIQKVICGFTSTPFGWRCRSCRLLNFVALAQTETASADAMRAEIVVLAAQGLGNLVIVNRQAVTRVTVATWRKRFAEQRLGGLVDEFDPGAPSVMKKSPRWSQRRG